MGWVIAIGLALLTAGGLWRFGRLPLGALQLAAAALSLGLAGYAWQARPDLPGSPTPPRAAAKQPDSDFALQRNRLLDRFGGAAQILDAADAFHRQGLDAYSVGLIKGALERSPNSPDLWVGLGTALTFHAEGRVTPAAELAFDRAAAIAPDHPAPSYFRGLAYAQSGQLDRADDIWTALLARAPADAPWRAEIAARLAELKRAEAGR